MSGYGVSIVYSGQQAIHGVLRDITERKQSERELRRLALTVSNVDEGVIVTDLEGRIEFVNDGLERLLGYERDELDGKPVSGLYPRGAASPALREIMEGLLAGGWSGQVELLAKDGKRVQTLEIASPIRDADGRLTGYMCNNTDISERKRAEEMVRARQDAQRRLVLESTVLAEISRLVGSSLDIEKVYDRFAEVVRKLIAFDRIVVSTVDLDHGTFTTVYAFGEGVPGRRSGETTRLTGTHTESVIRARSALLVQIEDSDAPREQLPTLSQEFGAGIRSLLSVPLIISKQQIFGVLHLRSKTPNAYTEADVDLVERVGARIAGAFVNAQLYEERVHVEEALREARDSLEQQVEKRTAQLAEANEILTKEVAIRRQTEKQIARSNEQLRALARRLESVREHIAREIHDELGQELTILKLQLSVLRRGLAHIRDGHELSAVVNKLASMEEAVDSTIASVHNISIQLRPTLLDDLELMAALEWQVMDFQSRTGIKCKLTTPGHEMALDPDRSTAVFRIFQESLTNVARHALAKRVEVSVVEDRGQLVLNAEDDGRGITLAEIEDPGALGILGMKERALVFGGSVDVQGETGTGTAVTVRIPLYGSRNGSDRQV